MKKDQYIISIMILTQHIVDRLFSLFELRAPPLSDNCSVLHYYLIICRNFTLFGFKAPPISNCNNFCINICIKSG